MRIVLVGAVRSTWAALETLADTPLCPVALCTLPLEKASRHSDYVDLRPAAARAGVPVVETANSNAPDALAALRALAPDFVLVIGWSQLCGAEFLAVPRRGTIAYHPAPLPENRGRAVIPWTVLQRHTVTGASLFWMDAGMDSGDILAQRHFAVDASETAATLYDKHLICLREMLAALVPAFQRDALPRTSQDHAKASFCARRTADDGYIDWQRPAEEIWTLIRATTEPYPGAFTVYASRKAIIWSADLVGDAPYFGLPGQIQDFVDGDALVQCGDGRHVRLRRVEFAGDGDAAPPQLKRHERFGVSPVPRW